jgi:hypothetical protein
VFVKPPYGRALRLWVPKCRREAERGNAELVVALLPARTDCGWWHEHVGLALASRRVALPRPAAAVLFLKGRVRFTVPSQQSVSATFPSVVVVWRSLP